MRMCVKYYVPITMLPSRWFGAGTYPDKVTSLSLVQRGLCVHSHIGSYMVYMYFLPTASPSHLMSTVKGQCACPSLMHTPWHCAESLTSLWAKGLPKSYMSRCMYCYAALKSTWPCSYRHPRILLVPAMGSMYYRVNLCLDLKSGGTINAVVW